jgi:hypothetical protein
MRVALLVSMLFLSACEANGPTMRPGENCKSCHDFSAAGTVFPGSQSGSGEGVSGVTVSLVDSTQKTVTMTSNSAGNFYTNQPVAWPATVTLALGNRAATMPNAPSGACATCHTTSGQGRVFLAP